MMMARQKIIGFLRWSQKYTQTDMVYLTKNGLWWVFGKTFVFLITVAIMTAFAHWLPQKIYGNYQYILSIVAILSIFSLPGMNAALIRIVARGFDRMLYVIFKEKLRWGLMGSVICLIISGWYLFHQNFSLGISFLIAAFFLPFFNAFYLSFFFWQGKKRFDIFGKHLFFLNFLAALVLIPVIFITNNLVIIILAYFGSRSALRGIFFVFALKKAENQNETETKEVLSFGKHFTLSQSAEIFGKEIDKIIIWQIMGPIPMAIYAFAQLPISRIQQIIPVYSLALPKLSQKNIKEIKNKIFEKFIKLFFVFIPFAISFILIAPYIYKILFPAYLESIPYFQALALVLVLTPTHLLLASLIAEMKKKELSIIMWGTPLLKIVLFLILGPLYGIWGIILAILISQTFNSGLTLYFFRKI